jgi:multicomponent Na+:H+ antiporter subunit E
VSVARRVVLLVVVWLLAWGELSLANVLSGTLLALALIVAFPPRRRSADSPRARLLAGIRLVLYVLAQLVPSNVLVARQVLSRRSRIRTGVLAYPLERSSDEVLSLMAHVIALTPGTMTVEVTRDPPVLYVHFLLLEDVDAARGELARLQRLAEAALGRPAVVGDRVVGDGVVGGGAR